MVRREMAELDRDLAGVPSDLRWREWMRRVEAVVFASRAPVAREALARVVGQGASIDLLIEDMRVDLERRPYVVVQVGAGWMLRTGTAYAPQIRAAAEGGSQALNLSEFDRAVLAAIAFQQPISRDLIGRLSERDLIGTGPREPRRSAPYTFVTTRTFLAAFGMESLRDLPDPEQRADAGLFHP